MGNFHMKVKSGVPQGLFRPFINYLKLGVNREVVKLSNDTKLFRCYKQKLILKSSKSIFPDLVNGQPNGKCCSVEIMSKRYTLGQKTVSSVKPGKKFWDCD